MSIDVEDEEACEVLNCLNNVSPDEFDNKTHPKLWTFLDAYLGRVKVSDEEFGIIMRAYIDHQYIGEIEPDEDNSKELQKSRCSSWQEN